MNSNPSSSFSSSFQSSFHFVNAHGSSNDRPLERSGMRTTSPSVLEVHQMFLERLDHVGGRRQPPLQGHWRIGICDSDEIAIRRSIDTALGMEVEPTFRLLKDYAEALDAQLSSKDCCLGHTRRIRERIAEVLQNPYFRGGTVDLSRSSIRDVVVDGNNNDIIVIGNHHNVHVRGDDNSLNVQDRSDPVGVPTRPSEVNPHNRDAVLVLRENGSNGPVAGQPNASSPGLNAISHTCPSGS